MAQSYVNGTSSTAAAVQHPLRSEWERVRAFIGGLVTSTGVTVVSYHWGRDVVVAVAASICVTIAIVPVTPSRLWYSPFLTGLGLGGLLTGTFLWIRPYDTGASGEWLLTVAVGSLLFWILPGRHGRPAFLLTMLLAAMVGVAVWGTNPTIDETDHIVRRFIDSFEPSVVTLIIFAVAYTLYATWLDLRSTHVGAGAFLVAAIIGACWAMIIVDTSQRPVVAALLLTGALLIIEGHQARRRVVESVGAVIVAVSAVRLLDAADISGTDLQTPDLPGYVQIGVALILIGVLIGRGVKSE